ncbi:ectoine/hydroxyectoine ABC transporter substrate-binding protein EhuB [Sporolactobacillus shoreicorticis]|uniref:Ectoine/hydroxyectoine ABC transporter substrate-binding protein EhuB n=1 Tax=Sporolactobacillus shoreicorticis TaxID=1923877 RepID=A0ABW5S3E0_9BACL|nr:ectoine/hydroxyectoine ABC transporter substrate-binding protein EhuB [Sporolactobacillus shoreicorticis]MCO7124258.1 ectoine/hydroxyectoine ABC transporter substrate-binding protein EhuB [Sporolactobacillus shoreicorticis]
MKKWVMTVMIALLVFGLVGCGNSGSESSNSGSKMTTFEKAKKSGHITVGFANEKPYAYATTDGKLEGEAVEVARVILKRLGIKEMDGVLTQFGSLIPGLKANRFDMITAGMYITPERAKEVDFANPDYSIGEAIAVKKGNPKNIKSYDDIKKNKNVTIGVMGGAAESKYLEESGVSKKQIKVYSDNPSALSALQAGRVDVITMTGPSLKSVLDTSKAKNVEKVEDFVQPTIDGKSIRSYGATVFRKSDDDFRKAFNEELEKMKKNGELLEILKKYGFTEDELPGDATVEELIK